MPEPSLGTIMKEHGASVHRVCSSILRDEHLGADAAQETFARLWGRIAEGRAPERFGGWLRRVAITTSLDLMRRRKPADDLADHDPVAAADPSQDAVQLELERSFEAALAVLSEGQRTVFLLRHSGGLKLSEVADALDVSLPTVKTQFARACLKLQALLAHLYPDEGNE